MSTIVARPPETGGVLVGPRDSDLVTEFFFDQAARCTSASYSPDHEAINRLSREVWRPAQLELKGFVHSHPDGLESPSGGDLAYIRRIFEANSELRVLLAPIVSPTRFRLHPFVIQRTPFLTQRAVLQVVDDAAPVTKANP